MVSKPPSVFRNLHTSQKRSGRFRQRASQALFNLNPHSFAHHPPEACFHEHVWYWRGFYWCKGCVVTTSGAIVGLFLQFLSGWLGSLDEYVVGIAFVALLLPTIITSITKAPRISKHVSRFLLGIVCSSAFLLIFVTDRWLVRLTIIAAFFAIRTPLERRRRKQISVILNESRGNSKRRGKPNGGTRRQK
jgi:hypothetical protein